MAGRRTTDLGRTVAPARHPGRPTGGTSRLTLAGVADGAIWLAWKQSGEPLGRVLERYGVKDAAKARQLTPYLTKNYDEVAKLMATEMGIDPDDDAYTTGEFGGKVVGTLTLAGAGTAGGWSGAGAKTFMPVAMKVLGLAGALKGIEDSAQNIANRIEAPEAHPAAELRPDAHGLADPRRAALHPRQ